ncbi:thiol:disulfide interchange protein DsbA [Kitasatospora cinereorecta]
MNFAAPAGRSTGSAATLPRVNPLLRSTVLLAAFAGLLGSPTGAVAAPAEPHEGPSSLGPDHPMPLRTASHRAVEFFWYDCTHSAQLEQPLERWALRHSADVTLRRIPAVWPGSGDEQVQRAHARLYYTLERLGEVDRLQQAVFRAVREQRADLTTEDRAAAWAVRQGVDEVRFRTAYRSQEVQRATAGAADLFTRYRITELPTVVLDEGFRTMPSRAGGVDAMPSVLDRAVEEG